MNIPFEMFTNWNNSIFDTVHSFNRKTLTWVTETYYSQVLAM